MRKLICTETTISTDILAEKHPSTWTDNVETIWVQSSINPERSQLAHLGNNL